MSRKMQRIAEVRRSTMRTVKRAAALQKSALLIFRPFLAREGGGASGPSFGPRGGRFLFDLIDGGERWRAAPARPRWPPRSS